MQRHGLLCMYSSGMFFISLFFIAALRNSFIHTILLIIVGLQQNTKVPVVMLPYQSDITSSGEYCRANLNLVICVVLSSQLWQ